MPQAFAHAVMSILQNYFDVSFRSQLPLRNLCKPLIWVSCFYEVLSLHLDFPNIVFNTLVIARLILPLIVDEQLHKNFALLNKITLLICNLYTINCSHFKGRDQWILTNVYTHGTTTMIFPSPPKVLLCLFPVNLPPWPPHPNNHWSAFFYCRFNLSFLKFNINWIIKYVFFHSYFLYSVLCFAGIGSSFI